MTETILQGHFDAADQAQNPFPLLPFDVPPGTARLHVHYNVSHRLSSDKVGWHEGNSIDIGLFDPRGAEFLSAQGFRGWSGSSLQEFTITADEASPGFLAGPLPPGTWYVVLGLHQLAPEGCDYRVTVTMEGGGQGDKETKRQGDKETRRQRKGGHEEGKTRGQEEGMRWYRGDLHAHSHHSDGSAPLRDLVAAARAQGLDFVAVTEHNTVSHLPLLPALTTDDLLLIPGIEVSTYRGHANVWPVRWPDDAFVEFRCWTDEQMVRVRDAVRRRGALFSVNHPKDEGPPWRFGDLFEPDCIEVWGAPWFVSNYQSLAVWDAQLRQGKRITAVGGSDKHQGPFEGELGWYEVGTPCTWVHAGDLSVEGIVDGIRAGRVVISEGPDGPHLELTAEGVGTDGNVVLGHIGDDLHLSLGTELCLRCRVQGGAGNLLRLVSAREIHQAEVVGGDFAYEGEVVVDGDTYWRAEVIEPPEVPLDEEPAALMAKGLSSPIYVRAA
jgi:hypothetical protein